MYSVDSVGGLVGATTHWPSSVHCAEPVGQCTVTEWLAALGRTRFVPPPPPNCLRFQQRTWVDGKKRHGVVVGSIVCHDHSNWRPVCWSPGQSVFSEKS